MLYANEMYMLFTNGNNEEFTLCNMCFHLQIPLHSYRQHGYVDVTMDTPAIPSLADVLWVAEDEGDSFAKIR